MSKLFEFLKALVVVAFLLATGIQPGEGGQQAAPTMARHHSFLAASLPWLLPVTLAALLLLFLALVPFLISRMSRRKNA